MTMDHERPRAVPTYAGLSIDRASEKRIDPVWTARLLAAPEAVIVPLWQDQCLLRGEPGTVVMLGAPAAGPVLEAVPEPVLLGLHEGRGIFAADLSGLDAYAACDLTGAERPVDIRTVAARLPHLDAGLLVYARGICHWHRHQRHCGSCGAPAYSSHAGHLRVCTGCGRQLFPRIEPAVIVLVQAPGNPPRCLLVRLRGAAEGRYAMVAGFVEIGEGLEDTVAREVREEAGLELTEVTYRGSQPWPFPAGIMLGFHARAASEHFSVDGDETVAACWFTRAELAEYAPAFRPDSIENHLAHDWLNLTEG